MKTPRLLSLFLGLLCAAASAVAQPAPPPLPPLPASPVEYFRKLLAMPPSEREPQLAAKPPASRRALEAKLAEYEKLPPEERDTRLRATELRWYLTRLMIVPAADRGPVVSSAPENFRKLVVARLRQWDQFPAEKRQQILTNETALAFFTRPESATPEPKTVPLAILPPPMREKMETDLARWKALPEEKRQRTVGSFQKFFDLDEKEKARALTVLSETERRQMEKTLQSFEKLPKAERERCLGAFQQFADLSPEDRAQFLKNAEQWQTMNAEDRQAWRQLVAQFGPPMPPMPPGFRPRPATMLVTTNY